MNTDQISAELFRIAATVLTDRASAFRAEAKMNPYWGIGYSAGVVNAMGGAGGRLALLFTPEVAETLAVLLTKTGDTFDAEVIHDAPECPDCGEGCAGHPDALVHDEGCGNWLVVYTEKEASCECFSEAITIARSILGETTGQATPCR